MFWFGECCAVPAQVGLVMTRHSPLFCCVCVARVPGLCPGILFMSCWYLWLLRFSGCLSISNAHVHKKFLHPTFELVETGGLASSTLALSS